MDKADIQEVAAKIAQTLQKSPTKLEFFKSHPEESIKEESGIKGITKKDTNSILDVLLKNSGDGGGLLGNVLGSLLDGKKTKTGEKNVVGELIKQFAGSKDSQVLIGSLLSQVLGQGAAETPTKTTKKSTGTSSTAKKSTTASTAKKSTGSSSTATKSATASTASKSTGTSTAAKKPASSASTAAKKPASSASTAAKKPASSSSTASKSTTSSTAKSTTAAATAKKPAGSSSSTAAKKPASSSSSSTAKKSTTTTAAKKAPAKTTAAKKGGSDDVLGTIGSIIDKSGIDVGDLVGNLLGKKSTKSTKSTKKK